MKGSTLAAWRFAALRALLPSTRAVFHKGKLLERPVDITPAEACQSTETEVA
jgi:putative transposase